MKKGIIVCIIAISFMVTLGISATATEEKIAKVGEYTITETTLKEYVLLSSVQNGSSGTLEQAVQLYTKAQIAAEEIAGTIYDIPKSTENELLKSETENFNRDYETNMAFCRENGISREELIRTVVTSKFNILIEGKHFSKVTDEYKQAVNHTSYTATELLKVYEDYMTTKASKLKFIQLNSEKVQRIEANAPRLNLETEKGSADDL